MAYQDALLAELARYEQYGNARRAAEVRAELARTGYMPEPAPAPFEDAAESTPREMAVPPKRGPGRPRKES